MSDSETAASNVIDDLAPWWAWGYVLAVPFALLTLVTPWFRAVPPTLPGVFGSDQHLDYHAWANFPLGFFGPVWLVVLGGQWYRARRHWRRPPGPSDWRPRARHWFFLIAVGLFVVTSIVGLLLSDRQPSWQPELREGPL